MSFRERRHNLLGDLPSFGEVGVVVDGAETLDALPGDEHLVMALVCFDRGREPVSLPIGQVLHAAAQDGGGPIQRIVLASAVAVNGLLDAVADLINRVGSQLHDVEGVQDGGRVVEIRCRGARAGPGDLPATVRDIRRLAARPG